MNRFAPSLPAPIYKVKSEVPCCRLHLPCCYYCLTKSLRNAVSKPLSPPPPPTPPTEHTRKYARTHTRVYSLVPYATHKKQTKNDQLLKRYVAYAKAHCHPTLTLKAARVLQKLYLTMRSEARDGRSMPITMRQLESLVRLSQVLLLLLLLFCFVFGGGEGGWGIRLILASTT